MFRYLLPLVLVAVWSTCAERDRDLSSDLDTARLLRPFTLKYGDTHIFSFLSYKKQDPGWGMNKHLVIDLKKKEEKKKKKGWGWMKTKKSKKKKSKKKKKKKKKKPKKKAEPKRKAKPKPKKKIKQKGKGRSQEYDHHLNPGMNVWNLGEGVARYGHPIGGYVIPEYIFDGKFGDSYNLPNE